MLRPEKAAVVQHPANPRYFVTRMVTEEVTQSGSPDPATVLATLRAVTEGKIVRLAVATHNKAGVISGSAVREFDENGIDLSRRSATVRAGDNGPIIELRIDSQTIQTIRLEGKPDQNGLASQIQGLWNSGMLQG